MKIFFIIIIGLISSVCHGQVEKDLLKGSNALTNKNYKKAFTYFDKVLKSDPDNERALILRSKANYELKNYDLTIKDCKQILKINASITAEDDVTALRNIGIALTSLRDFDTARIFFEKLLEFDSTDIKMYDNIGYGYFEQNEYDLALEQFLKMVSIDDKSAKGFYNIGRVYSVKGDFDNAIKAFDQAILINPSYAMAYQNRGAAKFEINDENGGCNDWNKSIELGMIQLEPYFKEFCR